MAKQRLQLTWYNKDKALIPIASGKYGYTWVEPSDPRYCETHTLIYDEYVTGKQTPKGDEFAYSACADLVPQEDNLLIRGESGDVLETLTRVPELADKYVGNVKLVYIDPPFNTAQTFASYEDNLEHSIWLTMMRDRLLHLKKLLSKDGSIWVHLDDVEVHRMRLLMDEVFGAANFVAEIGWQKSDTLRNDAGKFSADFDYILVYSKNPDWQPKRMPRPTEFDEKYKSPDGDPNPWFNAGPTAPGAATHQGMVYGIQNPITGEIHYPLKGRHWSWAQDAILECLNEYCPYEMKVIDDDARRAELCGVNIGDLRKDVPALLVAGDEEAAKASALKRHKDGKWPTYYFTAEGASGYPGKKTYRPDTGVAPQTWWPFEQAGSSRSARAEIKALFPGETPFSTPKPERLLERIIHIATNPGDIVLDCFAGSGTTAAVAQKMGRRWITCELLESTFNSYTRPRLEMVVNDQDSGGITRTKGERIPADGVELPEGVSPEDAAKFTSILNKLVADDDDLKKDKTVKTLKAKARTGRSKEVINWRGGGGFQVAHLAPECFDYDPKLDRVMLTPEATGELLVHSVAANLGFELLEYGDWDTYDGYYFEGYRGNTLLKVWEGVATQELVDWLISRLKEGQTMVLAATSIEDGVREHLRKNCRGSRVVNIPDDIFRYSKSEGGRYE